MKIFRKGTYVQIYFSGGEEWSTEECTPELWAFLGENSENEVAVRNRVLPNDGTYDMNRVKSSKILTLVGASVYMKDISEISIPQDLVQKILTAEEEGNTKDLQKYRNFWSLVSMNPDARVRNNIFWFLRKWDIKISDSGFIIAYRNATIKSKGKYSTSEIKNIIMTYYTLKAEGKDPFKEYYNENLTYGEVYNMILEGDDTPIYTDQHSHSTTIKLGKPVSMPRKETDSCQENTCSRGLHVASQGWLSNNYFGEVGLQVLVNPQDVVAVPPEDSYGKMRTCRYYPVALIDFDDEGKVIEPEINLHEDIDFLKQLKTEGEVNNEDLDHYTLMIKRSREEIYTDILNSIEQ